MSDDLSGGVPIETADPYTAPIEVGDAGPDPRDSRAEKGGDGKRHRDYTNDPKWENERQRRLGLKDSLRRGFEKAGLTPKDTVQELRERAQSKAKAAADKKPASTDVNPQQDAKLRREIIEKAFAKTEGKLSRKDLTSLEQRQIRRDLMARYRNHGGSDRSIGEIAKAYFDFREKSKADPVAARELAMEAFSRISPFAKDAAADDSKSTKDSVRRGFDDARDLAELAPFIEKYGKEMPAMLEEMAQFEKGMRDDPVGFSARYAAIHGAPITAAQHHAYEQKKAHQEHQERRIGEVTKAIGLIIDHKLMPGFEDEAVQNVVADVLSQNLIERTGDHLTDLTNAYHHVSRVHGNLNTVRQYVEALGVKVPKGQRSITGGSPSGSGGPRSAPAKSSRQALERILG